MLNPIGRELEREWHPIFIDGKITGEYSNRELCAIAFEAWAIVPFSEIPPNFGKGLASISTRLGVPAIDEHLTEYAIKNGWLKEGNK